MRPGPGVQSGADGAEGLGEHDARTAVEQAVGLRVALDGHRRDEPLRARLEHLDAHPLDERALELQAQRGEVVGSGRLRCVGHDGDAMPTARGSARRWHRARGGRASVADTRLRV